jgi:hypothetical protein
MTFPVQQTNEHMEQPESNLWPYQCCYQGIARIPIPLMSFFAQPKGGDVQRLELEHRRKGECWPAAERSM